MKKSENLESALKAVGEAVYFLMEHEEESGATDITFHLGQMLLGVAGVLRNANGTPDDTEWSAGMLVNRSVDGREGAANGR